MRHKKHQHHVFGHCPMCGLGYDSGCIEMLRKGERFTVVHAECSRCRSSAILTILSGMLGMVTTMGMLSDLARADIERFWNASEITSDDVLNVHVFLEKRVSRTAEEGVLQSGHGTSKSLNYADA
ncbi:MAG: hypothetical protein Q7S09_04465 [bacterium]|nr:hypothetical protein [bacterium]